MEILLDNVSKRYIQEWVFKGIFYNIKSSDKLAIIGPNGSGKSTLLQIISGYRLPSQGKVTFTSNGKMISGDDVFTRISFASPYMELIEEFTLKEQLNFHFLWKKPYLKLDQIPAIFTIDRAMNKPIKYFSSGMKQRLKLALAFCTESDILLLDEPTSNLDEEGIKVYENCLEKLLNERTLVIASNDKREYKICDSEIRIDNFK